MDTKNIFTKKQKEKIKIGTQLDLLFKKVRDKKGLYARFQFSVRIQIPSARALEYPDDPKILHEARIIASEIIGEEIN